MTLYLRPDADDLDGAWTNESGNNTNLYASLDETSASDSDYIQSPLNPVAETCRIALSNPTGGTPAEPFTLSYRFNNLGGTQLTVRLLQGTTPIASWNETGTGWTTSNRTLTSLQFAAISDFTNLFVELSASGLGGDTTLKLDLDFTAMAGTLDSRVTFARASAATYFNSSGVLTSASSGAPRFDYNPVNLAARGLLLENQKTNIVLWSRDLTNAAWTKTNVTAAKDQTGIDSVANSASKITATAGNGTCLQAITLASSLRFQSAYVKRVTGSGTVEMTTDNGSTWTAVAVTGSWTRVSIPAQTLANPTVGFRLVTSGDAIAVDAVQNEDGPFASSYIPTTNIAVARAADQAEITGTNFSSWYNQDEGAFVTEFTIPNIDYWYIWTVSNFEWYSYNEFFRHGPNGVNGNAEMAVFASGGQVAALSVTPVIVANAPHSTAFAYKINDFALCSNGGTIGPDTGGAVPTMSRMDLGSHLGNKSPIHFARLRYYNVRKTDAELRDLTGPSLDLDFTAGVLDSRVTFARASAATRVDATGLIATVASGAPRFDYNPSTLAPRGLLIEEQRTNLLLHSGDISNAAWIPSAATVATTTTAPDGTNTAYKLTEDGTNGFHYLLQYLTYTPGAHVFSVYLKDAGRTYAMVQLPVGAFPSDVSVLVNLATGTIVSGTGSIEAVGNGWYRVAVSNTATSTAATATQVLLHNGTSPSYAGGGSLGVYVWGAQVEVGARATSYIPTTTAAVTRAADSASMTGTNFSSWYNGAAGTFVLDFEDTRNAFVASSPAGTFLAVSSADSANVMRLYNGGYQYAVEHRVSGTWKWESGLMGDITPVVVQKLGFAYAAGDRVSAGQNVVYTGTSYGPEIPSGVDRLSLGSTTAGTEILTRVWMRRLRHYSVRKTNTELQALTA